MEQFHFKGFDPVEPVRSKASAAYERVLEAAPSDARVTAKLEKDGTLYHCSFEIGSLAWPATVSVAHRNPWMAIDKAEAAIQRKLERWKLLRFSALHGNARELADVSA